MHKSRGCLSAARMNPLFPEIVSRIVAVAVLSLLPLAGGCVIVAAGAAGAGAVAYVRGELSAGLEHELTPVYKATQRALKELEFAKISEQSSAVDAHLLYRTALDRRVEIKLKKTGSRLTEVRIRIDLIGDQALARMILDKIKAELD
jgi:hypothetical protein